MSRTAYYDLASVILGEDVGTWILRRRPDTSWQEIAYQLREAADHPRITPTDMTVRHWADWATAHDTEKSTDEQ